MNWEEAKALKIGDLVKYHNEFWGEEFICVVSGSKSVSIDGDDWIETQLVAIIEDEGGDAGSGGHIIAPINSKYWERIA
jgi:hypothetical protein